jgi:hypothetical protein
VLYDIQGNIHQTLPALGPLLNLAVVRHVEQIHLVILVETVLHGQPNIASHIN